MNKPLHILEALNVAYNVGEKTLLNALNLHVETGQALGIVGPNGAGKSTLLKVLAGFLTPSKGSIHLNQVDIQSLSTRQRAQQVAVVHPRERPPAFPMNVMQYLKYGRAPFQNRFGHWSPEDQKALEEAIESCKTHPLLHVSLHKLSSGEWQRVQLTRALVQTPQVLLLDEPTAHLDIGAQSELMDVLKQQQAKGLTLIAVIHDLNLANQFMDQILLLHQANAFAIGPGTEVLTPPILESVYKIKWQNVEAHDAEIPILVPDFRQSRALPRD